MPKQRACFCKVQLNGSFKFDKLSKIFKIKLFSLYVEKQAFKSDFEIAI